MHSEARVEGACGDLEWRCLVDSVSGRLEMLMVDLRTVHSFAGHLAAFPPERSRQL